LPTPNCGHACNIRLAVDRMNRGQDTGYIDVATFGKPAEAAAKHLVKGQRVAVEGKLDYHEWDASDGSKRNAIAIIGRVEFLDRPRNPESTDSEPTVAAADGGEIPF